MAETRFTRFVLVGGVVFGGGIGLNVILVSVLQWPKLAAYALVAASQALVGFLSNRYFIFDGRDRCPVRTGAGYLLFFSLFRLADWGLYSAAVTWWAVPYVAAQITNNVFFFLAKFVTYRWVFEGRLSGRGHGPCMKPPRTPRLGTR